MTQSFQSTTSDLNDLALGIKSIEQKDERTLALEWTDGLKQDLDVVMLRRKCPCAVCIDEWTHQRKIRDADIADTVRPLRIDSVGRYAMNIVFDDQHKTGIYTYPLLRAILSKS